LLPQPYLPLGIDRSCNGSKGSVVLQNSCFVIG
jgi:hypothetical protein